MTEPDIEKKKKKRRRSARVYISNAHPLPSPEQLAALVDQFPSDEDDDQAVAKPDRVKRRFTQAQRRQLAREGKALPDGSYPVETAEDLHNGAVLARTGHGDVEAARKLIARRAKELGVSNPLESSAKAMFNTAAPYGEPDYASHRVSAPVTDGHASPSTGDHGVGQGRGSHIAAHHPDLKQSNTSFDQVLARLRTVAGDNQYGDRSVTYTAGEVGLRMFDAAGQAGHYHDMQPVNPSPQRPDWHTARNSATAPNGGHSLASPQSNAVSLKASDAREIMKRHLFPGSGGAR